MYVCSLHEKDCPCRLCSIARVTVTRGYAFHVTVSTSQKVCSRIHNAEITDFNFKRNNTLTCSAICRSLALGLLPSGHDGLLVQTLSFSSGCHLFWLSLWKGGSPYSPGFVPVWCLPEQESLESDEPPGSLLPLLRRFFGATGSHMHTLSSFFFFYRCLTRLVFAECSFITSSIGNTKGKLFTKK